MAENLVQWSRPEVIAPEVGKDGLSFTSSPDGQAISILFDDLQISFGEAESCLSKVRTLSLQVPISLSEKGSLLGYLQDIRGFIKKGKNARGVIVLDLGGTSKVIEYPYDQEIEENFIHSLFSIERRVSKEQNPNTVALPPYNVSIFMLIQRRSGDESVLMTVDAIDGPVDVR